MKSIVAVALVSFGLTLSAIEPQNLTHFKAVPPQVRLHFTNFCLGNYDALFANNELGFTQLATTPGLTPALLELANLHELAQEWDGFTRSWGLLAQRTDATDDEQRLVRDKLRALLNRNADPGGSTFKRLGLTFLGHYSSEENQKILIQYLEDTNGGPLHADLSEEAAASLGKIGTATSIEALRMYAEKRKPAPGSKSRYYETAVAALDQIKGRIEAVPRFGISPSGSASHQPRSAKSNENHSAPTPSEVPASSMPWSIIVVLIVAAGGLLWLLLKRRS